MKKIFYRIVFAKRVCKYNQYSINPSFKKGDIFRDNLTLKEVREIFKHPHVTYSHGSSDFTVYDHSDVEVLKVTQIIKIKEKTEKIKI